MKLSNKSRYGVRAVFDIAFHRRGQATQIKEIAERQAIPPRFLEQIFQDLKRAGLVSSRRGPKGGYQLAVEPSAITIGDVIRALQGPVALASDGEDEAGDATSRAITEGAFRELSEQITACLDGLTVEQLCERGESDGLRRQASRKHVYTI